jgi:hypothetical protein
MIQMHNDSVEIVCPEGAVFAPRIPFGRKHEVIDDQLASAIEKFRKRLFPM